MQNRLVYLLVGALSYHQLALAQIPTPPQPTGAYQVKSLRLIVLEGDNAVNSIQARIGTPVVVEVRDENERPVQNASVTFTLPATGPGVTFADGQRSQTRTTDIHGQAGTSGLITNGIAGKWAMRVTATHQGLTSSTLIAQTNSAKARELGATGKSGGKWKWVLLGVAVGGGIVAGVYFGTQSSSSPVSVTTGPVIVSGPR